MDEKTVREDAQARPKSFYSFNLTEERIIFIFVSLVMFIAIVIFLILIVFSKKNQNVDLKNEPGDNSEITLDREYQFYNGMVANPGDETVNGQDESEPNGEETLLAEINGKTSEDEPAEETVESGESTGEKTKDEADKPVYASEYLDKKEEKSETTTPERPFVEVTKKENKKPEQQTAARTTTTAAPDTKETVRKERNEQYVIQIASYTEKSNAEKISRFYEDSGYPVYIKSKVQNNKTYYRLRVGPFTDKTKAAEQLAAIQKSKYGKDSYISIGYF